MEQNAISEEEKYLETLVSYLDKELGQIRSHAEWYRERAKREKRRFYYIRIPMIVASFILSLIVAVEMAVQGLSALTIASVSLSLLIGFLGSIDALLGYGKSWIEKREAELLLYSLLRKYKREKLKIYTPQTRGEDLGNARFRLNGILPEPGSVFGERNGIFKCKVPFWPRGAG